MPLLAASFALSTLFSYPVPLLSLLSCTVCFSRVKPLLGGFLYGSLLKERLFQYLQQTRRGIERVVRKKLKKEVDFTTDLFLKKHLDRRGAVTLPLE
jgi:hypothetical protein